MLIRRSASLFKRLVFLPRKLYYNIWFRVHHLDPNKVASLGLPQIEVKKGGTIQLNGHLYMTNTAKDATLGINRKCKLLVYKDALLEIDGPLSMSNTVIVATNHIKIGNNVMMGGGVTIVDSDFHSLDYNYWGTPDDVKYMKSAPVNIGNNVFIGMQSIILKGVIIGDGAVIAAGSVVSQDIPSNEIWGGSPARFIKKRLF